MADFMRDVDKEKLPPEIISGIHMHRLVDLYTDAHPIVRELRKNFSTSRRRFSGVVLDVVFDHFLIKYWSQFCDDDLDEFVDDCYSALWRQRSYMPERMELVVGWMIKRDWIRSYSELDHVGRALDGLASRLKMEHGFHGAIEEVENMYEDIESGFREFFPQLRYHVDENSKALTDSVQRSTQ
ncbi:DUF479 domain-containing protein [bacterium]|nr:DUF479 domain-containing protein [bacterium]